MTRLEYSDYYKFCVSIGVAAITLAVLTPWLLLHESYDLLTLVPPEGTRTEILELGDKHLNLLQVLAATLPFLSIGLFTVGVLFIGFGLFGWKRRQGREEERAELEVEKLRHEVRALTEAEVETKAASAAAEDVSETEVEMATGVYGQANTQKYLEIERRMARRIKECLGDAYSVLVDQRVGPALMDILIRGDSDDHQDAIVEIKYARSGFKYGWVSESANRNALAADIYGRSTGRSARSVTLFIAPGSALNEGMLPYYRKQFRAEASLIGLSASIAFLEEENIDTLSCTQLREWILGVE